MVSIVDIARAAGVSHQVVSKTLNGGESNSGASAATRSKVLKLAREMGYRPSSAGRAMRRGKYFSVGLLISPGEAFLLPESTMAALALGLSRAGYTCTLHCARTEERDSIFKTPLLSEVHADCLLISYVRPLPEETVARVEALGTPVIWMNRAAPENSVYVDEKQGALLLAEHLAGEGHRHLTLVDYSTDFDAPFFKQRFEALRDFCSENGMLFSLIQRRFPRRDRAAHVEDWLSMPNAPSAVIANSLSTAQIICQTALRRGLHLARDLSVCSFDSGNWHQANCPPITCAIRSDFEFGDAVARAALERLKHPSRPLKSVSIPFTLSRGGTTSGAGGAGPVKTA